MLPLSEYLGVDGTVWRCSFSEVTFPRIAYIRGRARELEEVQDSFFPEDWESGEFLIRLHENRATMLSGPELRRQTDFASALWGTTVMEGLSDMLEGMEGHPVSWAEVVAVRKGTMNCRDCGNVALSLAMRGSIAALRSLQTAFSYAQNTANLKLISVETMQAMVPVQMSKCDLSGDLLELGEVYPVMPYLMIQRKHFVFESDPSSEWPSGAAYALRSVANERIFSRYIDLIVEAAEAIYGRGQASQGLMVAAQACEYLLDMSLFFMMWWEGLTPKQGASEFESTKNLIFARVKASYSVRLGDSWDPQTGVLARWRDHVARPRNRVIHGGTIVSLAESEEALEVARELKATLASIFSEEENSKKYPPLQALLVGDEFSLNRSSSMTENDFYSHLERPAERFRAWVALLQGEMAFSNSPSVDRSDIIISRQKSGGFEWLIFDPDAHKIIEVDIGSLPRRRERREIEARNAEFIREGMRGKYSRFGFSPMPSIRAGSSWRNATAYGPGFPWQCPWSKTDRE